MHVPLTPIRALYRAVDLYANKTGVVSGDRRFTYAEFGERVERLAFGLLSEGVVPGDRVAYLSFNTHQLLEGYFAAPLIRAIVMPLNVRLTAAELAAILIDRKADAVFIPFPLDGHPDHRTANYILAGALGKISWNVRVFGYEVWGLCIPNVVLIIDDVIETKTEMLRCFTFANSALDYVNSTLGLNMFHSRMLGAGQCRYAERFFEVPREEYIGLVGRIHAAESAAAVTP